MNVIRLISRYIYVYHCMDCTSFIESQQTDANDEKLKRRK